MKSLVPSRGDVFFPLEQCFNKLYDDFFADSNLNSIKGRVGYPKIDVLTEGDKWIIEVACPGIESKDINVEILPNRTLSIFGKSNVERTDAKYHIKELRRTSFERKLVLPDFITGEPEAVMKNGLLSLTWTVPELKTPEKKIIQIKDES